MNYILYCLIAAIGCASSLAGVQEGDETMHGDGLEIEIDRSKIMSKIPVERTRTLGLSSDQTIVSLSPNGKKILVYLANTLSYALYETESGHKIIDISKHSCCEDVPCVSAFNQASSIFALATHCHKTNEEILKLIDEGNHEYALSISDFNSESIAISQNGMVIACAGGCSDEKIAVFKRQLNGQFSACKLFGKGHLVALNHDGMRLAALNHDQLTIYDLATAQPNQIVNIAVQDVPALHFQSNGDLAVALPASKIIGDTSCAQVMRITQPAAGIGHVTIKEVGNKIVHLVKGAPCITYFVDEKRDCSVVLEKPSSKINILRLNEGDARLTACTDGEVYCYDLNRLKHAEQRFMKPIEHLSANDLQIARKISELSEEQHQRIIMADDVAQMPPIEREIHALHSPTKPKSCNSVINRFCYPLVGVVAAALTLCALRN